MPRPASRSSRRAQTSSIRGLLIADALRSWVPPTVALVALGATMLLDALELVPDRAAATIAVIALLVLGAFIAAAPLLDDRDGSPRVASALVVGGALVWVAVLAYPFVLRLVPGAPLRRVPLEATAKGAAFADPAEASRVDVVVDAHLPLASDRRDRAVHYDLDLVETDGAHEHLAGELGDSWRMRRMGRRGSAPSHFEHLSAVHVLDVTAFGPLRVGEAMISGEHGATAVATVFRHRSPPAAVLYGLAALLFGAALAVEGWWDRNLTTTATMVTASAVVAMLVFSQSGGGHPGIRDVIGAALVGAVVGVPAGAGAAWLARTFRPRTRKAPRGA